MLGMPLHIVQWLAPLALVLGLTAPAGGPERTFIRTAIIHGVSGPVYYSSLEGRYLPVGPRNEEEVAGLDTTAPEQ